MYAQLNHGIPTSSQAIEPALDDASRTHYDAFGWCVVPGFFPVHEVEQLRHWTDQLMALPEMPGRHMLYRERSVFNSADQLVQRIENFCPFHGDFDRVIRGGRLAAAVAYLMGESALLFKEKINFKMPGGAGFEAHQDQQAGWSTYAPIFVTAMVSLDDATLENGCLAFTGLPRRTALIGREWAPLGEMELPARLLEPLPTRAGDVIFFDSFAPHASKANLTDEQRRVLYLTFNPASAGDHRSRYFADKRASFPPDVERVPGAVYKFRV